MNDVFILVRVVRENISLGLRSFYFPVYLLSHDIGGGRRRFLTFGYHDRIQLIAPLHDQFSVCNRESCHEACVRRHWSDIVVAVLNALDLQVQFETTLVVFTYAKWR